MGYDDVMSFVDDAELGEAGAYREMRVAVGDTVLAHTAGAALAARGARGLARRPPRAYRRWAPRGAGRAAAARARRLGARGLAPPPF